MLLGWWNYGDRRNRNGPETQTYVSALKRSSSVWITPLASVQWGSTSTWYPLDNDRIRRGCSETYPSDSHCLLLPSSLCTFVIFLLFLLFSQSVIISPFPPHLWFCFISIQCRVGKNGIKEGPVRSAWFGIHYESSHLLGGECLSVTNANFCSSVPFSVPGAQMGLDLWKPFGTHEVIFKEGRSFSLFERFVLGGQSYSVPESQ